MPSPRRWTAGGEISRAEPIRGGTGEETGLREFSGGVPEWPKGTDCKSVGAAFGGSNPPSPTSDNWSGSGTHSLGLLCLFG